ncbi:MAG TPA: prepilin-type N-terminal cleavage/methylation domain-containing protein [Longimicrobiaceae bacterium]|nr:prepilin-type N-terminal cleavage/methylation domain-containing protein [Longimicrobiaceae bacterium]
MTGDSARLRSDDGFTLVEVLAAMMILAVGLLGLEALGIGASRMLVRAEKESRVSTLAATHLEAGLRQARANPAGTGSSCPVEERGKDTVCVTVQAVTGVAKTRRVTVTVRPVRGAVRVDSFVVSSTFYDPAIP